MSSGYPPGCHFEDFDAYGEPAELSACHHGVGFDEECEECAVEDKEEPQPEVNHAK
jgi:hypothetical protein